jgi:hypothetical protein
MASAESLIPTLSADKTSPPPVTPKSVAVFSSGFDSDRLLRKNVWVAALLALFLGPPGMVYSTPLGTLVMSVVAIPVWFYGGPLLLSAVWCVCIFWAVMAARD